MFRLCNAQYTPRLSAVSHSAASDEAFSVTGAPAPRHLAAEQASSAAVLAMTTWQPDPVHLVEPVGHAGNAAAQSYRQITAIHRTSAGGLRHPDVDGSRCISGTPAAQRMSRTVSAADFFTPGTTCLARVLAGPSRCTRAGPLGEECGLPRLQRARKLSVYTHVAPKGRSKLAFKGCNG